MELLLLIVVLVLGSGGIVLLYLLVMGVFSHQIPDVPDDEPSPGQLYPRHSLADEDRLNTDDWWKE